MFDLNVDDLFQNMVGVTKMCATTTSLKKKKVHEVENVNGWIDKLNDWESSSDDEEEDEEEEENGTPVQTEGDDSVDLMNRESVQPTKAVEVAEDPDPYATHIDDHAQAASGDAGCVPASMSNLALHMFYSTQHQLNYILQHYQLKTCKTHSQCVQLNVSWNAKYMHTPVVTLCEAEEKLNTFQHVCQDQIDLTMWGCQYKPADIFCGAIGMLAFKRLARFLQNKYGKFLRPFLDNMYSELFNSPRRQSPITSGPNPLPSATPASVSSAVSELVTHTPQKPARHGTKRKRQVSQSQCQSQSQSQSQPSTVSQQRNVDSVRKFMNAHLKAREAAHALYVKMLENLMSE